MVVVSKKPKADEPQTPSTPEEEVPLSLADDTDGSTQPVDGDAGSSRDAPALVGT